MIFYATFGQKYVEVIHPRFFGAHPDMVLEVQATDEATARELLRKYLDNMYAFLYTPSTISWEYFPKGATHVLTEKGITRKES